MAQELLKRSEVKEEYTWNVKDMYESDAAWEKDIEIILDLADQISAYEGTVGQSAENLFNVVSLYAKMDEKLNFASEYASRLYDVDTTDIFHQEMESKISGVYSKIGTLLSFYEPEIIAIDDETFNGYYNQSEALVFYRKYINEIRRLKDHMLSAELSKIVSLTNDMSKTPSNIFSVLNNADIQFPEMQDENGDTVRLTHFRFISLLESKNPKVREEAFKKYYSTYKQFLNTYAAMYNGQIKQQIFYAKVRNYSSALESALVPSDVPVSVYHTLIETVGKNVEKLHRYVALRKRLLGVESLHMRDIYTPIIPDASKKIPYSQAQDIIVKALGVLGEDYTDKLKEGFANRWIDVYENQGKKAIAYSAGVYGTHPFILLNHFESMDGMFTLAHEMGHALHSYYSNMTQPYIYSQYKMFVAEVASTCNEILLLEYLLKNTDDKKEKQYLLNQYLDMFKGTLFRQTQLAEFELKSNEMVESGTDLNAKNATDLYFEINQKYYGPAMDCEEEIGYEWARIPHYYFNFYMYQYATSFSAAVTIAHEILTQGAPMVEKYKKFLSSGCTDSPISLLRELGVDLETPEPIQIAIDCMDEAIDRLEALLKD